MILRASMSNAIRTDPQMFARAEQHRYRSQVQFHMCAMFWLSSTFKQIGRRWPRLIVGALAIARAGNYAGISGNRSTNQIVRASGKCQESFGVCCSQLPALNRASNAGRRHGWRATGQSEAHALSGSSPPNCQRLLYHQQH
jgi:hypothetical protein